MDCLKHIAAILLLSLGPATARDSIARHPASAGTPPAAAAKTFTSEIQPLLQRYCYDCHGEKKKGDLDLRIYRNAQNAKDARAVFEKVRHNLVAHEMPPENKPQPTAAERERISQWIESEILVCDCAWPDPGRVTIRRLNRAEYSNTIRDLLGVRFEAAEDFPADDAGYGFDNIGDVLSISPLLFEKYLGAAEKILKSAKLDRFYPADTTNRNDLATAPIVIRNFAARAWRRPVAPSEMTRLLRLFEGTAGAGETVESRLKEVFQAVLISPHFLFRGELQSNPDDPTFAHEIDDYALASRLSYFLWSSMPDDELMVLAERQVLRRNLAAQVKRMLQDSKAGALVENFAGQWLQLRNLKLATPDPAMFPAFDEDLRAAMEKETELFFDYIMRADHSVLEFLNANYTFLNDRLARHYGLTNIEGSAFRKVNLKASDRGGLLGQASILTITSNPTRTSPVKRGKWVLENILGTPPPPPPPEVPELKDNPEARLTGTLRQRMEQHRTDPNCAVCHSRMDPIGFAFENFDAIGAWRDREENFTVDASGSLSSGETFKGPRELRKALLKSKEEEFVRCLTEKMLTYALGRGLEYYDKCAEDEIVRQMAKGGNRFSTLIQAVVQSAPFQLRRGEASNVGQAIQPADSGDFSASAARRRPVARNTGQESPVNRQTGMSALPAAGTVQNGN